MTAAPWTTRDGLDVPGVQAADAQLKELGFRLVSLTAAPGPLYAGVWRHDGGPETEAELALTQPQLEQALQARAAAGFGPVALTGCETGGTVSYAAVLERGAPAIEVHLGLDRTALLAALHRERAAGRRPVLLAAFAAGGAGAFALGTDTRAGPAWMITVDLAQARFRTLLNLRLARGFRADVVETYAVDGTARYAGLWLAGRGAPSLVLPEVPAQQLPATLEPWQHRGFALTHLSARPDGAAGPLFAATLAQPAAPDPASQFLHDLMTNAQLASDWTAAVANPHAVPLRELDQYLDNWLASHGYDCSVTDVSSALAKMKAHDLAYWTGVYGKTTLGAGHAAPPLMISGNGLNAVTVDGIIVHDWTYADGTLSWTATANLTAGRITLTEDLPGPDDVTPGMKFAGTLTLPQDPPPAPAPVPQIYQGRIGPLPAQSETTGVKSAQVAFSIINHVINVVQAARILYRGGELAAEYGPKLLQAAQARLAGEPVDVEGQAPDVAGEAGGDVLDEAGEAIGEATGEALGEAAGEAAVDAAAEAAIEAGIEIGAAAAPEIAEGIGAAAAAAL